MANPFQFIQEVRAEADKVTWPTRRETLITTGLVIVMVLFAALFFVAVDQALRLFVDLDPEHRALNALQQRPEAVPMSMRWYIVHAYSNFEKKVAESIREQAAQRGLADKFEEILVPTEQVVEVRRGRKINSERKFFPGYVLVKCDLVRRHLSSDQEHAEGHRLSWRRQEADADFGHRGGSHQGPGRRGRRAAEGLDLFEIGETVRVADGPFASFNGVVEEVDEGRSRVKVAVSIFGRATPVELEYAQVEKV